MEAMIQQLRKSVVDQKSYLECIEKRFASARKAEFTEEKCNECERLFKKYSEESTKLSYLRSSLAYMRRAAGHEDVDTFYPERF